MDDIVRTAEQIAVIEAARAYVEGIGPIDLTNAGQLTGHLMAAELLLTKITAAFAETERTDMDELEQMNRQYEEIDQAEYAEFMDDMDRQDAESAERYGLGD